MKKKVILFFLSLCLYGQTVEIKETLLDSFGNNLVGFLDIANAAFILPTGSTATITNCSNATPIQVTTSAAHGFSTGQTIYIVGVTGNLACNGTWTITFVDATNFTLVGSAGNGAWVSGGTAQRRINVGAKHQRYPTSSTFNGAIDIAGLYPTTTAEAIPGGGPAGFTYNVTYNLSDGSTFVERWNIPPTPTITTISAIRTPGVLNPTATVSLSQLSGAGAGDTRNANISWNGTAPIWLLDDVQINAQTGTTYTFLDSDRNKVIRHSNTAATADTLPQAGGSGQFIAGWYTWVCNDNTGEVTITPTVSTIDGQATLKLRVGMCTYLVSDGANYFSTGPNPGTAGANFANIIRSLFTSTADRTQANTASEVTIIGTGVGTLTLPINSYDAAGASLHIQAAGYYSNTGTPTITFKVKHGATVLGSTGAVTTTTGATNWQWWFDGQITARTVGGSAGMIVEGRLLIQTGANAISIYPMLQTATVAVNSGATQAVDLTIQWGTASASNTITGATFAMYPVSTPL